MALAANFKTQTTKQLAPLPFISKRARPSSITPVLIVNPADAFVPPGMRNVFVDDHLTTSAQHPANFIQHRPDILGVMQHITEQHGID